MDRMLTLMQIAALLVAGMCHALLGSVKVPLGANSKSTKRAWVAWSVCSDSH